MNVNWAAKVVIISELGRDNLHFGQKMPLFLFLFPIFAPHYDPKDPFHTVFGAVVGLVFLLREA